jgi:hypothetical protein
MIVKWFWKNVIGKEVFSLFQTLGLKNLKTKKIDPLGPFYFIDVF